MYNLKEEKGSYKGLIGECMFLMKNKGAISRILYGKDKFFKIFSKYLNQQQKEFLNKYYYSIDAIKIKDGITIYEIKTENYYIPYLNYKPKTTYSIYKIFEEAKKLNICTKLIIVKLFDNWNFELKEFDFKKSLIYIDKPKKYDNFDSNLSF